MSELDTKNNTKDSFQQYFGAKFFFEIGPLKLGPHFLRVRLRLRGRWDKTGGLLAAGPMFPVAQMPQHPRQLCSRWEG